MRFSCAGRHPCSQCYSATLVVWRLALPEDFTTGAGQYLEGYPDGLQPQMMMLLDMTSDGYGYWSDSIAVVYSGALKKVYEKNVVTVYGVCDGQYSYTSVAGYDMTVPLIVARYVTKN